MCVGCDCSLAACFRNPLPRSINQVPRQHLFPWRVHSLKGVGDRRFTVKPAGFKHVHDVGASQDYYISFPMNSSQSIRSQSHCKNMGGTFRYIERLRNQPTNY